MKKINDHAKEAAVERWFPLMLWDLKDELVFRLMDKMLPFGREHGLLVIGDAGVGKTPFAKIWCHILATYQINSKGGNKKSQIRKGQSMEEFRTKNQSLGEALLLDDPLMEMLKPDPLKLWFDVAESGAGPARYTNAKFTANQPRVLVTNEMNAKADRGPSETFTHEERCIHIERLTNDRPYASRRVEAGRLT